MDNTDDVPLRWVSYHPIVYKAKWGDWLVFYGYSGEPNMCRWIVPGTARP